MSKCCIGKCSAPFNRSNLPVLLKCKHPACFGCVGQIRDEMNGEKWITLTCNICGEQDEIEIEYHKKYGHLILESLKNQDFLPKIKLDGPTILC